MEDGGSSPEALLEQAPACHWIVDAEGTFLRVYGDVTPIFGKTSEQITGNTTLVLGKEAGSTWKARFDRAFQGETQRLRERRGNSNWYVSVFPILLGEQIRFVGGIAMEATPWSTAEQELRNTVLSALKSQEFERNMLSRFLHDNIAQNLTAFGLQLDLIRMDLEPLSPDTCTRIGEIQKVVEGMMEQVREYSYALNPSDAERAGLRSALDRFASRIRQRYSGTLRLNVDPSLKVEPKIAAALYQIVQEAVENAVQHSSCSGIEIAVKSTRNGPMLEVRDNGKGFDPSDTVGSRRGLGLLSMEHHAAQVGMDLSVTSNPGMGTTVRVASGRGT